MNEETTRMLDRYGEALHVVSDGGLVSLDAAQLALHLALSERLNDVSGADRCVDRRDYERLNDQIARINDYLAENEVGFYQDPDTDTADAIIAAATALRGRLQNALVTNRNLGLELNELREWIVEFDADNTVLTARIVELEEQLLAATAAGHSTLAQIEMRNDGASGFDWSQLSAEAQDYRIGIEAGRWRYGQVPKRIRLELLRCVAAQLCASHGRLPTMVEFDVAKPTWMSLSTSHQQVFGKPWHVLVGDDEIEVAP